MVVDTAKARLPIWVHSSGRFGVPAWTAKGSETLKRWWTPGPSYTTLPASLLRELGIEPRGKRRVPLADGRRIDLDYGQASASIDGESVITLVVFGEDNAPAQLGTYTLDGLALAVDPTKQRLVPKPLIMY